MIFTLIHSFVAATIITLVGNLVVYLYGMDVTPSSWLASFMGSMITCVAFLEYMEYQDKNNPEDAPEES